MPRLALAMIATLALLAGCGVSSNNPPPSRNPNAGFTARFALASTGFILPFPNDLYFNGSTDGTVNIQGLPDPSDFTNPLVAINTLDGFSTTAPTTESFTAGLDPQSLTSSSVFVFQVTTDPSQGYVVTGIVRELMPGVDYAAAPSTSDASVLDITPTTALDPESSYMVVLTDGIQDTSGDVAQPSATFAEIKQDIANGTVSSDPTLAQVEPLFGAMLQAAAGAGISSADVVATWTFSTQSEGAVLSTIATNVQPGNLTLTDTGLTTVDVNPALPGYAEIYVGDLTIPYYSGVPTPSDPSPPLTDFWHGAGGSLLTRYNPAPVPTTTLTIPVLMTIPAPGSPYFQFGGQYPPNGWPIAIFQHGIDGDRTNMLAVADTFAQSGVAAIAIDLPLHGVTDTTSPFYQACCERTFNLPTGLTTNPPTPGTSIAPSGTYFINLSYLLTSRDNLREAVADLLRLTETLPTASFQATLAGGGTQTEQFNADLTYFSSLSLGAMAGIPYLAEVPQIPGYGTTIKLQSATLSSPGGKIAYLLETSPTFAPVINAGLAQVGLFPGTVIYDQFFQQAQTVVDSGDPLNYVAAAATNFPINMTEIVGDPQQGNPPDQVVPNWTTDLLVNAMPLTQYGQTTVDPAGLRSIVRFTSGSHGSLLDPTSDPVVTEQEQLEMDVFAVGCLPGLVPGCPDTGGPPNGQTLDIAFPSVVQQPH
ncbi:MAG: Ig-like domain-containing protein [Gammaproteobacteria bacterium]